VLPGFNLTLGYTVLYLSLIVLIPLSGLFFKTATMTWDDFVSTVTAPRVLASYQLSFGASFIAAIINAVFGFLVAWVLVRYRFPGNVRELQNVVERAVVFCHGDSIALKDLPDRVQSNNSTGGLSALPAANGHATHSIEAVLLEGQVWPTLDEMQKRYVQLILKEVDGNKRRAAALLGIGRRTLYRWLGEDDL